MADVRVIGLDIAKSVFQPYGVDAAERPFCRSGLRDRAAAVLREAFSVSGGIEACATCTFGLERGWDVRWLAAQLYAPHLGENRMASSLR